MTAQIPPAAASASANGPLALLDAAARARLAALADHFIPAAHGMPSAADVLTDDRLRFVLEARPDLVEPLLAALRSELGNEPRMRLDALAQDDPAVLAALQLVIVAGYYTDRRVRELIGYPGQMAIEVKSWLFPEYLDEGLIDAVLARGAIWRDPATGRRAEDKGVPKTYAERFTGATPAATSATAQGGSDGSDRT
ncbi:MAG TPA: hypothetical protein VFI28_06950 [Candidatus Limnocylindrales bacterium]|nr:hypothetical protein [Candidatus Limnocylindrales bacterium]